MQFIFKINKRQPTFGDVLGTFGAPGSVELTNSSEHWATDDAYVKVNCDATSFITDVGWIAQNIIVILFRSKNMNIIFVKRSENKTTICLVRFCFTIRL